MPPRRGQPNPASTPSDNRNTRSLRILVVDDDPLVGAGTVAMIEDLGHVAIDAESAARALEILRSEPNIDVVITDYAMPGMNGGQLAAEIHRIWPRIPVVIATGYADVLDNGLDLRLLQKPYQQRDLAELFETLIEPPADL
jgi:CheY-like chemotaxis protein